MEFNRPTASLPFGGPSFTGSDFEAFCGQLLQSGLRVTLDDSAGKAVAYEIANARHRKAPGLAQGGRDFEADAFRLTPTGRSDDPPERWFFECKHRAEVGAFTLGDARDAARGCPSPDATRKFLLLSQTFGHTDEFEATEPTWQLWDGRRLQALVLDLPPERAALLIYRAFGSIWVKRLVPRGALNAPLLSAAAAFEASLQENSLFFHPHKFHGPPDGLDALLAALENADARVIVLQAVGGAGKSRLLLELARRLGSGEKPRRVLFFNPGSADRELHLEFFDCDAVLVFDDAHLWPQEHVRLLGAAKRHPGTQIVLATRPHLTAHLTHDARSLGFDPGAISSPITLPPVWPAPAIRRLLFEELPGLDEDDLRQLVQAADGSPLVATFAAQLIRHKKLTSKEALGTPDLLGEILDRFARDNFESLASQTPQSDWFRLVELLSALSPFQPTSAATEAAAKFLGWTPDAVHRRIELLIKSGLVQESDSRLRVWPDIFSDYLVQKACVTEKLGVTPFARDLPRHFSWQEFPNLLRNFALAAWRIGATDKDAAEGITAALVGDFRKTFDLASWRERIAMLGHWSQCAYFLPEHTLALARQTLDQTETPPDPFRPWAASSISQVEARSWILDQVPPLLATVAAHYPGERQKRALDYLWELRRERPGPAFLGRASTLQHFAEVVIAGLKHHPDVVQGAWQWARTLIEFELDGGGEIFTGKEPVLVELLTPFIARWRPDNYTEGELLQRADRQVPESQTRELRGEVFSLTERIAANPDPRLAHALLPFLRKAAAPGVERFPLYDASDRRWLPDRLRALAIVRKMLAAHSHPVLHFALRRFLHESFYEDETPEFSDALKAALAAVPDSIERDLLAACAGTPADFTPNAPEAEIGAEFEERRQARTRHAAATAVRVAQQYPDPLALIERLRWLSAEAARFHYRMLEPDLGRALCRLAPDYAMRLAEALIPAGNSSVDWLWRPLLEDAPLPEQRAERLRLARVAAAANRASLTAVVIGSLGRWARHAPADKDEAAFVLDLADRTAASHTSDWLASLHIEAAAPLELWLEVVNRLPDVPDDPAAQSTAAYQIVDLAKLPPDETRRALLTALLTRLVPLPKLEDTFSFALGEAARDHFDAVMHFLVARLDRARAGGAPVSGYQFLPHRFNSLPPASREVAAPWQEKIWSRLTSATASGSEPAHRLFRKAFARSGDAYEEFLRTKATEAESVAELKSIAAILSQLPREPAPWLPAVIRRILESSRSRFADSTAEIEEALLEACVPSSWGWAGNQHDESTRAVLESLRRLRSEWNHDSLMRRFLERALREAEQRYRRA